MSLSHHLEDEDSHMRISRRHTLDHSNGDLHVLASTAISIFFFFMGTIRHVFAGAEKMYSVKRVTTIYLTFNQKA